jgi:hypothetical protein
MQKTREERDDTATLGACLSDLTAHLFALVTEDERGPALDQRLVDVLASLGSVRHRAVRIVAKRRAVSPDGPPEVRIDP